MKTFEWLIDLRIKILTRECTVQGIIACFMSHLTPPIFHLTRRQMILQTSFLTISWVELTRIIRPLDSSIIKGAQERICTLMQTCKINSKSLEFLTVEWEAKNSLLWAPPLHLFTWNLKIWWMNLTNSFSNNENFCDP